ncbi:hypothetical protein Syun_007579 [Stephania yunnanensis]|uniref:Uncharacterized protein n=1 Tax=Stephania yunnanensis TaxID=152371 RepID=A0AAP0L081_9MAGN
MEGSQEEDRLLEEVSDQKGGLRTLPFILVVDCFEEVASFGLALYMILYLVNEYHMETAAGTSLLFLWSSLSSFLTIVGAYASDTHFGRYRVILCGSICSILGLVILWLTSAVPQAKPPPCDRHSDSCKPPTHLQLTILVSSLLLLSIGAGCTRPCTTAFGADQIAIREDGSENERILQSFFNWYYAAGGISTIISLTVNVYIQDHFGWQLGFGVPAVLMFLAAILFLVGSPLYVKVKANSSALTGLAQALVAAFKARHLELPPYTEEACYRHDKESKITKPSDKLRYLNKACLIKNTEQDLASKSWELCTVDEVEALKSVIGVIPIWMSGIIMFLNLGQASIVVLQAETMDRHITSNVEIPPGSFCTFAVVSLMVSIAFYERIISPLLAKHTKIGRLSPVTRMIIGLVFACLSLTVGAVVENVRRKTAIRGGGSAAAAPAQAQARTMSAMWVVPPLVLGGIAEGISAAARIEYYYSHLPNSMSTIAVALFTLESAFSGLLGSLMVNVVNSITSNGGKASWYASDINDGRYDYYLALHGGLGLLNLLVFLVSCLASGHSKEKQPTILHETGELKNNLL